MTERKTQVGDIVLNTRVEGRSDAPWVTFCNSLATDLSMYDAQAAALAGDYRILRYDRRGHGDRSAAGERGGQQRPQHRARDEPSGVVEPTAR